MLKLLSMLNVLNVRVSTSSVYMASWQAKSQAQVERVERVERVEPGPENLFVRTESSPRCTKSTSVLVKWAKR